MWGLWIRDSRILVFLFYIWETGVQRDEKIPAAGKQACETNSDFSESGGLTLTKELLHFAPSFLAFSPISHVSISAVLTLSNIFFHLSLIGWL